jgi:hypothetical protein
MDLGPRRTIDSVAGPDALVHSTLVGPLLHWSMHKGGPGHAGISPGRYRFYQRLVDDMILHG